MLNSRMLRDVGGISRAIAVDSDNRFKKHGFTRGQHVFVTRVCEHPGISPTELSRLLNVDKSTTTKSIQKLEGAGYVRRECDERARAVALYPTARAERVYEQLIARENEQVEIVCEGLSPEERRQAESLLERMAHNASALM